MSKRPAFNMLQSFQSWSIFLDQEFITDYFSENNLWYTINYFRYVVEFEKSLIESADLTNGIVRPVSAERFLHRNLTFLSFSCLQAFPQFTQVFLHIYLHFDILKEVPKPRKKGWYAELSNVYILEVRTDICLYFCRPRTYIAKMKRWHLILHQESES